MNHQIDWRDREKVEALRRTFGHELSSHAFLSMYLWRRQLGLFLVVEENLFTARIAREKNCWFFPCGSEPAIRDFLKRHEEADFGMRYLRQQDVELVRKLAGDSFVFTRDADASEYIYERRGHEALAGKAYANVRTQLHKIEREHEMRAERITRENLPLCMQVLEEWEQEHETGAGWARESCRVDAEGLENSEIFGIDGIVVFADGRPAGVAAGYPLTEDTYDLFLAKAAYSYPGLSYYIQRSFFLSRPDGVDYINMEEDLGMEGLRSMKQRLSPVRMNELWRADKKV